MKEIKDLRFEEWDTGAPVDGEFVLRVSKLIRDHAEEEWSNHTFKLGFDDPEERTECIVHYTKLYGSSNKELRYN